MLDAPGKFASTKLNYISKQILITHPITFCRTIDCDDKNMTSFDRSLLIDELINVQNNMHVKIHNETL